MSFESQNMAVRSDLQPLFGAWSYSDLCADLASALTGILNVKCVLG